jgi:hypothetical protein
MQWQNLALKSRKGFDHSLICDSQFDPAFGDRILDHMF